MTLHFYRTCLETQNRPSYNMHGDFLSDVYWASEMCYFHVILEVLYV